MATDNTRARRFYERGVYFYQIDRMADAVVNLRDAIELMPEHFAARLYLGAALGKQKKYLDAINVLEEGRQRSALVDDRLKLKLLHLLASICLVRQDFPAAKYYIDAALKLFPNSPLLQNMRASVLCRDGKFEEGLDAFMCAMEQSTLPQE